VLCYLALDGRESQRVAGFAYDFASGRTLSLFPDPTGANNKSRPPDLQVKRKHLRELIDSHGGLREERIDRETIQRSGKRVWTWEVPSP
jgi:hypothetical protein